MEVILHYCIILPILQIDVLSFSCEYQRNSLLQVMAWMISGIMPLPEPMLT